MIVRWIAVGATAVVLITGFVALNRVSEQRSASVRADLIEGCTRTNVLRRGLYDFADAAAETRRAEARMESGGAADSSRKAARSYQDTADDLVSAADEVPASPGSPEVDCEEAYE